MQQGYTVDQLSIVWNADVNLKTIVICLYTQTHRHTDTQTNSQYKF